MLSLLLLLVITQSPAVPGETTLVSVCKQGSASACEALKQVNPQKAAELEREAAKAALRLQALKVAEEEAEKHASEGSSAETDGEPPNCDGQNHHIISKPIAEALQKHRTLRGLYEPRDKRFETRAKDKESHCGYQKWHRDVDDEVVGWLKEHENATPDEFMAKLREIYKRPDMVERFPNGF